MAAGHEIAVCRLADKDERYTFDGVDCRLIGAERLAAFAEHFRPDAVAIHGLDEQSWPAIASLDARWPVFAWLHGSEIPAFFHAKAERIEDAAAREVALAAVARRAGFWQSLLSAWPEKFHLGLVSHYSLMLLQEDLGNRLNDRPIAIIPNPIDTDLFAYAEKPVEQRFNVLSIRPYDSATYGNDLAVATVLRLSTHPGFAKARFTFVGDGPMFDEVLAPLHSFANVDIHRRFLRQEEIAQFHAINGIFLVPTRLDTQGVSRDEAMASGLVPVTNAVCSIPEYADDACAVLAGAEDVAAMADGIGRLWDNPSLFHTMSAAAAARVRSQSGHHIVIPQELDWMGSV